MKKLIALLLIVSPFGALAQVNVTPQGDIVADVCVYGRGETAVSAAVTEGSVEILEFIRGSKIYSETSQAEQLGLNTTATEELSSWLSRLRSMQQQGLSGQALPVTHSRPRIEGNDTCVQVTLARNAMPSNSQDMGNLEWGEEDQTVSVVVIGEGWANATDNITARNAAETDAFKRAVSQVAGVWLNQQRSQFNASDSSYVDGQETTQFKDIVSQQLHSRSSGMIREWTLLSSKELPNNGVEVTIQAVVERQQVIAATNDILAAIGSPRVQIQAPESIKPTLMDWLREQGIEVNTQANLIVQASTRLIATGNNSRLTLEVAVKDRAGNVYSRWANDNSIIALPNNNDTERKLVEVHLAVPEQTAALNASMYKGFTNVVAQGGLVHKVIISQRYIAEPEKVQALMATIGGASNVVTASNKNVITVNLRYAGSTGNLVAAIEQSLAPIIRSALPRAVVHNAYEVVYQ